MKKSKRRNNGYYMIIKLVAIVFCLVTVTFSWFIFSKEGWINPFDVNVSKAINVVISEDQETWFDKLVVEDDSSNYGTFTEFSGDGDKLYIPIISNKTITGYYKPDYSNRKKDYVEINTWIKSNGAIKLFLDPSSSITPSDENRFEDNIAGAVRVAFIAKKYDTGDMIQKPIIWAPNSTYEYDKDTNTVNKEGKVEPLYKYVYKSTNEKIIGTDSFIEIPTNSQPYGISEDKNFMWGDLSKINNYTANAKPLFTISDNNSVEETIVPLTIRVWVEGEDREAVAPLISGKVKMKLKFKSESN